MFRINPSPLSLVLHPESPVLSLDIAFLLENLHAEPTLLALLEES
jgi:hypothetical protein